MITWGFPASYSDVVVNDAYFTISDTDTTKLIAAYIGIGSAGDIIWENNKGEAQWIPSAVAAAGVLLPIGAQRILSAATIRGVPRTTTATGLVWFAVNQLYNAP
jgi:hypothetical protein